MRKLFAPGARESAKAPPPRTGPPRRTAAGSEEAFAAISGLRRPARGRSKEKPEFQIQRALVTALYALLQPLYPGVIVHHGDAGDKDPATRRRKKELGAYATFPDLAIYLPGRVLVIEVKEPGNTPTEGQKETIRRLTAMGHDGTWVTSVEAGLAWVRRTLDLG